MRGPCEAWPCVWADTRAAHEATVHAEARAGMEYRAPPSGRTLIHSSIGTLLFRTLALYGFTVRYVKSTLIGVRNSTVQTRAQTQVTLLSPLAVAHLPRRTTGTVPYRKAVHGGLVPTHASIIIPRSDLGIRFTVPVRAPAFAWRRPRPGVAAPRALRRRTRARRAHPPSPAR